MSQFTVPRQFDGIEGETIPFSVEFEEIVTGQNPSAVAFLNGQEITSDVFPLGTDTVSGNTAVYKPLVIRANDGEQTYRVTWSLEDLSGHKKSRISEILISKVSE